MKRASLPLSFRSFLLTHYCIVSPICEAWCALESGNFSCSLSSLLPCRAELHGRVAPIISTFPLLPLTPQPTPFPRPLLPFCQVQQDPHNWKIDGHTLCLDCVLPLTTVPVCEVLLHICPSFLLWNLAFTRQSMQIPSQLFQECWGCECRLLSVPILRVLSQVLSPEKKWRERRKRSKATR